MSGRVDFSGVRLLVVGDLMLDRYWFGDVERISPEAPVPVVRVLRSDERLGGAANVALNAAALGAQVVLAGIVGDDEPGRIIARLAHQAGIATELAVDAELATTVKLRVIGRQQQLVRIDFEEAPGASARHAKLDRIRRRMTGQDVVVLSDYGKGGLADVAAIIAAARDAGRPVIVDPKGHDYARYRGATLLKPNRAELRQVVGPWRDEADLRERAQRLRDELELPYLLLTRSEEGMTLFSQDAVLHVPARAREVYDVSGAGDTVLAVIAAMFAAGSPIAAAVELANSAGAIVVGKLGTATVSVAELFD